MPQAKATSDLETTEKKTPRKRPASKKSPAKKITTKAADTKKTLRKKPVTTTKAKKPVTRTSKKESVAADVEQPENDNNEVDYIDSMPTQSVQREKTAGISGRKAPTAFAGQAEAKRATQKQIGVIVGLLVVGVASSAILGFTDPEAGQIDVAQTIKERNARMSNMVDVDGPTVVAAPMPERSNLPDGGFIAATNQPKPAPVTLPVATSSVATSSDALASTTDSGVTSTPSTTEIDDTTTSATSTEPTSEQADGSPADSSTAE